MIVYSFTYGQAKMILDFFETFPYPEKFECFAEYEEGAEDLPLFYNRSENVNQGTVLYDEIGFQLTKRIKPEGFCQRFLNWLCRRNNRVPLFLSEKASCFLHYYLTAVQAFLRKEVLDMECEGKRECHTDYLATVVAVGFCEDVLYKVRALMQFAPFERGCDDDL